MSSFATIMETYREYSWDASTMSRAPLLVGAITPDDPATYRGGLRQYDLGGVVAEVRTASAHRFERTSDDVAEGGVRRIATLVLGEGRAVGHVDGRSFTVRRGDVLLLEDNHPIEYRCDSGFRMLRVVVDAAIMPTHLQGGDLLPASILPRTKLVNSTVAFLSALFSGSTDPSPEPQLRTVLIDLQVAMIAQARQAQQPVDAGDLRSRIEAHVRANLGDPSLSPAAIAAANGISLRYLHLVFNREGETIARFVREERLAAVASALRQAAGGEAFGDLGARYGFASRDQLARAFRAKYGSTMTEYREQHLA